RHPRPLEREELEVGAVVAGRLQARLAGALRNPGRRRHLVERAPLPAAHRVAGKREQIRFEISIANAVDRILPARADGDDRNDHDGAPETASTEAHDILPTSISVPS